MRASSSTDTSLCDDAARVTLEPTLDLDENGKGYVETTAVGGDAKTGASSRKRRLVFPLRGRRERPFGILGRGVALSTS